MFAALFLINLTDTSLHFLPLYSLENTAFPPKVVTLVTANRDSGMHCCDAHAVVCYETFHYARGLYTIERHYVN